MWIGDFVKGEVLRDGGSLHVHGGPLLANAHILPTVLWHLQSLLVILFIFYVYNCLSLKSCKCNALLCRILQMDFQPTRAHWVLVVNGFLSASFLFLVCSSRTRRTDVTLVPSSVRRETFTFCCNFENITLVKEGALLHVNGNCELQKLPFAGKGGNHELTRSNNAFAVDALSCKLCSHGLSDPDQSKSDFLKSNKYIFFNSKVSGFIFQVRSLSEETKVKAETHK